MSNEARFEVFPAMAFMPPRPSGEFCWRFRATNGQVVAGGGETFTRREDANRAIHDFLDAATGAEPHPPIIDVEE